MTTRFDIGRLVVIYAWLLGALVISASLSRQPPTGLLPRPCSEPVTESDSNSQGVLFQGCAESVDVGPATVWPGGILRDTTIWIQDSPLGFRFRIIRMELHNVSIFLTNCVGNENNLITGDSVLYDVAFELFNANLRNGLRFTNTTLFRVHVAYLNSVVDGSFGGPDPQDSSVTSQQLVYFSTVTSVTDSSVWISNCTAHLRGSLVSSIVNVNGAVSNTSITVENTKLVTPTRSSALLLFYSSLFSRGTISVTSSSYVMDYANGVGAPLLQSFLALVVGAQFQNVAVSIQSCSTASHNVFALSASSWSGGRLDVINLTDTVLDPDYSTVVSVINASAMTNVVVLFASTNITLGNKDATLIATVFIDRATLMTNSSVIIQDSSWYLMGKSTLVGAFVQGASLVNSTLAMLRHNIFVSTCDSTRSSFSLAAIVVSSLSGGSALSISDVAIVAVVDNGTLAPSCRSLSDVISNPMVALVNSTAAHSYVSVKNVSWTATSPLLAIRESTLEGTEVELDNASFALVVTGEVDLPFPIAITEVTWTGGSFSMRNSTVVLSINPGVVDLTCALVAFADCNMTAVDIVVSRQCRLIADTTNVNVPVVSGLVVGAFRSPTASWASGRLVVSDSTFWMTGTTGLSAMVFSMSSARNVSLVVTSCSINVTARATASPKDVALAVVLGVQQGSVVFESGAPALPNRYESCSLVFVDTFMSVSATSVFPDAGTLSAVLGSNQSDWLSSSFVFSGCTVQTQHFVVCTVPVRSAPGSVLPALDALQISITNGTNITIESTSTSAAVIYLIDVAFRAPVFLQLSNRSTVTLHCNVTNPVGLLSIVGVQRLAQAAGFPMDSIVVEVSGYAKIRAVVTLHSSGLPAAPPTPAPTSDPAAPVVEPLKGLQSTVVALSGVGGTLLQVRALTLSLRDSIVTLDQGDAVGLVFAFNASAESLSVVLSRTIVVLNSSGTYSSTTTLLFLISSNVGAVVVSAEYAAVHFVVNASVNTDSLVGGYFVAMRGPGTVKSIDLSFSNESLLRGWQVGQVPAAAKDTVFTFVACLISAVHVGNASVRYTGYTSLEFHCSDCIVLTFSSTNVMTNNGGKMDSMQFSMSDGASLTSYSTSTKGSKSLEQITDNLEGTSAVCAILLAYAFSFQSLAITIASESHLTFSATIAGLVIVGTTDASGNVSIAQTSGARVDILSSSVGFLVGHLTSRSSTRFDTLRIVIMDGAVANISVLSADGGCIAALHIVLNTSLKASYLTVASGGTLLTTATTTDASDTNATTTTTTPAPATSVSTQPGVATLFFCQSGDVSTVTLSLIYICTVFVVANNGVAAPLLAIGSDRADAYVRFSNVTLTLHVGATLYVTATPPNVTADQELPSFGNFGTQLNGLATLSLMYRTIVTDALVLNVQYSSRLFVVSSIAVLQLFTDSNIHQTTTLVSDSGTVALMNPPNRTATILVFQFFTTTTVGIDSVTVASLSTIYLTNEASSPSLASNTSASAPNASFATLTFITTVNCTVDSILATISGNSSLVVSGVDAVCLGAALQSTIVTRSVLVSLSAFSSIHLDCSTSRPANLSLDSLAVAPGVSGLMAIVSQSVVRGIHLVFDQASTVSVTGNSAAVLVAIADVAVNPSAPVTAVNLTMSITQKSELSLNSSLLAATIIAVDVRLTAAVTVAEYSSLSALGSNRSTVSALLLCSKCKVPSAQVIVREQSVITASLLSRATSSADMASSESLLVANLFSVVGDSANIEGLSLVVANNSALIVAAYPATNRSTVNVSLSGASFDSISGIAAVLMATSGAALSNVSTHLDNASALTLNGVVASYVLCVGSFRDASLSADRDSRVTLTTAGVAAVFVAAVDSTVPVVAPSLLLSRNSSCLLQLPAAGGTITNGLYCVLVATGASLSRMAIRVQNGSTLTLSCDVCVATVCQTVAVPLLNSSLEFRDRSRLSIVATTTAIVMPTVDMLMLLYENNFDTGKLLKAVLTGNTITSKSVVSILTVADATVSSVELVVDHTTVELAGVMATGTLLVSSTARNTSIRYVNGSVVTVSCGRSSAPYNILLNILFGMAATLLTLASAPQLSFTEVIMSNSRITLDVGVALTATAVLVVGDTNVSAFGGGDNLRIAATDSSDIRIGIESGLSLISLTFNGVAFVPYVILASPPIACFVHVEKLHGTTAAAAPLAQTGGKDLPQCNVTICRSTVIRIFAPRPATNFSNGTFASNIVSIQVCSSISVVVSMDATSGVERHPSVGNTTSAVAAQQPFPTVLITDAAQIQLHITVGGNLLQGSHMGLVVVVDTTVSAGSQIVISPQGIAELPQSLYGVTNSCAVLVLRSTLNSTVIRVQDVSFFPLRHALGSSSAALAYVDRGSLLSENSSVQVRNCTTQTTVPVVLLFGVQHLVALSFVLNRFELLPSAQQGLAAAVGPIQLNRAPGAPSPTSVPQLSTTGAQDVRYGPLLMIDSNQCPGWTNVLDLTSTVFSPSSVVPTGDDNRSVVVALDVSCNTFSRNRSWVRRTFPFTTRAMLRDVSFHEYAVSLATGRSCSLSNTESGSLTPSIVASHSLSTTASGSATVSKRPSHTEDSDSLSSSNLQTITDSVTQSANGTTLTLSIKPPTKTVSQYVAKRPCPVISSSSTFPEVVTDTALATQRVKLNLTLPEGYRWWNRPWSYDEVLFFSFDVAAPPNADNGAVTSVPQPTGMTQFRTSSLLLNKTEWAFSGSPTYRSILVTLPPLPSYRLLVAEVVTLTFLPRSLEFQCVPGDTLPSTIFVVYPETATALVSTATIVGSVASIASLGSPESQLFIILSGSSCSTAVQSATLNKGSTFALSPFYTNGAEMMVYGNIGIVLALVVLQNMVAALVFAIKFRSKVGAPVQLDPLQRSDGHGGGSEHGSNAGAKEIQNDADSLSNESGLNRAVATKWDYRLASWARVQFPALSYALSLILCQGIVLGAGRIVSHGAGGSYAFVAVVVACLFVVLGTWGFSALLRLPKEMLLSGRINKMSTAYRSEAPHFFSYDRYRNARGFWKLITPIGRWSPREQTAMFGKYFGSMQGQFSRLAPYPTVMSLLTTVVAVLPFQPGAGCIVQFALIATMPFVAGVLVIVYRPLRIPAVSYISGCLHFLASGVAILTALVSANVGDTITVQLLQLAFSTSASFLVLLRTLVGARVFFCENFLWKDVDFRVGNAAYAALSALFGDSGGDVQVNRADLRRQPRRHDKSRSQMPEVHLDDSSELSELEIPVEATAKPPPRPLADIHGDMIRLNESRIRHHKSIQAMQRCGPPPHHGDRIARLNQLLRLCALSREYRGLLVELREGGGYIPTHVIDEEDL